MSLFGIGDSHKPAEDLELLVTVYDLPSRAVVASILEDAGIPFLINERGGSVSVVTGNSMLGTDFFVKNTDLELATKIIESFNDDELPEEVAEEETEEEEDGK